MGALSVLFPLALVLLVLVGAIALTHRILATMAFRNTLRRPRQSLLIVLGLLVGTMIISGALVAGDSMEYAIVEASFDAFQEVDESVYLDGYNFFPQTVEASLRNDPILRREVEAVGANILWDAAVTNERTHLYEPNIRFIGFDPAADRPFGPFERNGATFTGESLAPDEVVIAEELADQLDARVGDRLTLNFSQPNDPLLPTFQRFVGRINVSVGGIPPLTTYLEPQPWTTTFPVNASVVRLSAVLAWTPGTTGQDLDFELVTPSQRTYANQNGSLDDPDVPAVVNITGSLAQPLESGTWTIRVHAKAAVETDFNVTLVLLDPVFDLVQYHARVQQLQRQFPNFDPSQLESFASKRTQEVRVAWITDTGKGPNFKLPNRLNLFARLDSMQTWLDRPGQVNWVKISNHGGVESGVEDTDRVMPILWTRLNATKAQVPQDPAIQALKALNDKQFWIDQAQRVGQLFSVFLTFVGSFSVIAGLMLIINIFTMLAEERKIELGIARAVGLRRRHLTRLFLLEGALYALPAALIGTFAGLGLARLLIWGFNAFGDPDFFPPIPFRVNADSLPLAFATGLLLTLVTVYVAARKVSRLNVVRAIRSLEEPERLRGNWALLASAALAAFGLAASLYAAATDSFMWQVLGPTSLALGAAFLLRRFYSRRAVYPLVGAFLFAYLTATLFLIKTYDSDESNLFGPLRAVIMAVSLVVIVVYNERVARTIGRLAAKLRPLRAVALPAVSYPLHKKFRTGMTLAMFGVILLVVSLFTIFGALFAPDPEKEAGGYDVQAFASVPIESLEGHGNNPGLLDRVNHYDVLPYFRQYGGQLVRVNNQTTAQFGPPQDSIYGTNDAFAQSNQFRLLRRDPAYASDAAAYLAVAHSSNLVIIAYPYSTDEQGNDDVHKVGEVLQVEARGGVKAFRIVGIQEQIHFKGIFVSRAALQEMYANVDTLLLIDLKPSEDAETSAKDFEAAYRDVGLDASSIRTEVLRESEQFRQIFTLIRLFLSLGLIVGILSLGIVTARSVIERRQEIGMMRALGYRRADIRRTFLLEMITMVALGILIGTVVALIVSLGLWVALLQELRIPYVVPWADLGVIALIAFVATTLATLAPIIRASKIPPAEALRYIE